jgi:hypothetical protein
MAFAFHAELTSSITLRVILASSPQRLVVEGRLTSAVRDESRGRKPGDCRSIELSCCHRETIGTISDRASGESSGVAGRTFSGLWSVESD